MSHVVNDPNDFADEAVHGFVAAHRGMVSKVPGGVARRGGSAAGVAVVIGGGSGHYPAFAGLVGPGLAHAAALGNVFASPSAQQIYEVAKSVAGPAGVLLSYGNYAGDVLNFDQAQRRLNDEGIPCATVRVTDDIFSAGEHERQKRRGIAGDLPVFKAAAWAAEQGHPLEQVVEFTSRANDRTRTIGVAFSGCTLPGADQPLFTVPVGQMAVGMGIHGEPGIETVPLPDADGIAELLVMRLLAERPGDRAGSRSNRVAVILNGLGSVKSEELFVLYGAIEKLLEQAGLVIVEPEVGEFATSFEMAGVSLTLLWLDEDLECSWRAPAFTPGYRKSGVTFERSESDGDPELAGVVDTVPEASAESRHAATGICNVFRVIHEVIDHEAEELGRLDAIAGDGDHGIGMQRGARAAADAAAQTREAGGGAGTVLARAGDAWAHRAGGTSGALWGAGLRAAGERIGDTEAPSAAAVADAMQDARRVVQRLGKAVVGDKTLVDALVPFTNELTERVRGGASLANAWSVAAESASRAAEATANLLPRMGRARPHAEKSAGTPDPGAVSFALVMRAVSDVLSAGEVSAGETVISEATAADDAAASTLQNEG